MSSRLSLVTKAALLNFPSASSIEYHNGLLYVIGDDARNLAILDTNYKLIDTIELFPGDSLRIPKKIKADLEASTIIQYNNKDALLVAGSASKPHREYLLLFPLDDMRQYEKISTHAFTHKLLHMGLKQVNFEGLATVNNMLVFGNRGNLSDPQNHLIIVPAENLQALENADPLLIDFDITADGIFKGVSGLSYVSSFDMLLFTASIENTDDAFEDGPIGSSYLGYVSSFCSKMNEDVIIPDELIDLSEQTAFQHEKIEAVAIESAGDELVLHLVADNDNGTSTLFKLSFLNPLK